MKNFILQFIAALTIVAPAFAGEVGPRDKSLNQQSGFNTDTANRLGTKQNDSLSVVSERHSCREIGQATIFTDDDGQMVVKTSKGAIHILSSTNASCSSFENEKEFEAAASLNRQKASLLKKAEGCFDRGCMEVVETEDFKAGECKSARCNACREILAKVKYDRSQKTVEPTRKNSGEPRKSSIDAL